MLGLGVCCVGGLVSPWGGRDTSGCPAARFPTTHMEADNFSPPPHNVSGRSNTGDVVSGVEQPRLFLCAVVPLLLLRGGLLWMVLPRGV